MTKPKTTRKRQWDMLMPQTCKYCRQRFQWKNKPRYLSHLRHHEMWMLPHWFWYGKVKRTRTAKPKKVRVIKKEKPVKCRLVVELVDIFGWRNKRKQFPHQLHAEFSPILRAVEVDLKTILHLNSTKSKNNHSMSQTSDRVPERTEDIKNASIKCENNSGEIQAKKSVHSAITKFDTFSGHDTGKTEIRSLCKSSNFNEIKSSSNDNGRTGLKPENNLTGYADTGKPADVNNNEIPSAGQVSLAKEEREGVLPRQRGKQSTFPCHFCDKVFKRRPSRACHEAIHTGERKHKCQFCDQTFIQRASKNKHEMSHFGLTKTHKCRHCDKWFAATHSRRIHEMKIHTGILSYDCKICNASFPSSKEKKAHENAHRKERRYKCGYCDNSFLTMSHKKAHERTHTGEKPFQCRFCKKRFIQMCMMQRCEHRHTGVRFACRYCDKDFCRVGARNNHERIHIGDTTFMCSYCGKICENSVTLKMHEMTHSGEKPFKCSFCERRFTRKEHLLRHEKIHTGIGIFKCSFCSKEFRGKSDWKRHENSHTFEKVYRCNFCNMGFSSSSGQRRHERTHIGDRKHKCDKCEKTFVTPAHLRRHQNVHNKNRNRPYPCGFCHKAFATTDSMKYHENMVHLKQWKFKCHFCERKFVTGVNRRYHEASQHTGEKTCACSYCDKKFIWPIQCKHHEMKFHTGVGMFDCHQCPKKFVTKRQKQLHVISVHSLVKPYQCKFCDKGFPSFLRLTYHERTHRGKYDFQCEICPERFAHMGARTDHKKRYHPNGQDIKCKWCDRRFKTMANKQAHERLYACKQGVICHTCGLKYCRDKDFDKHNKGHHGITKAPLQTPTLKSEPVFKVESMSNLETFPKTEENDISESVPKETIKAEPPTVAEGKSAVSCELTPEREENSVAEPVPIPKSKRKTVPSARKESVSKLKGKSVAKKKRPASQKDPNSKEKTARGRRRLSEAKERTTSESAPEEKEKPFSRPKAKAREKPVPVSQKDSFVKTKSVLDTGSVATAKKKRCLRTGQISKIKGKQVTAVPGPDPTAKGKPVSAAIIDSKETPISSPRSLVKARKKAPSNSKAKDKEFSDSKPVPKGKEPSVSEVGLEARPFLGTESDLKPKDKKTVTVPTPTSKQKPIPRAGPTSNAKKSKPIANIPEAPILELDLKPEVNSFSKAGPDPKGKKNSVSTTKQKAKKRPAPRAEPVSKNKVISNLKQDLQSKEKAVLGSDQVGLFHEVEPNSGSNGNLHHVPELDSKTNEMVVTEVYHNAKQASVSSAETCPSIKESAPQDNRPD